MTVVLSLFDHSGVWAHAFELFGCDVVQVDLKHGDDIGTWSARSLLADLLQRFPSIDGVVGAPPCTAFARSGAHAWPAKDADGRTAAAVHLVLQNLRTVDFLRPRFWAIENPPGRLQRLVPAVGPIAFSFNPCDYAGWSTDESDEQALQVLRARGGASSLADVDLVRRTGAYTKHTLLWGRFETPAPAELPPVKCSSQGSWTQRLGGTSEHTKEERSVTPEGFALAFAAAQVGASLGRLADVSRQRCADLAAIRRQAGEQLVLGGLAA